MSIYTPKEEMQPEVPEKISFDFQEKSKPFVLSGYFGPKSFPFMEFSSEIIILKYVVKLLNCW